MWGKDGLGAWVASLAEQVKGVWCRALWVAHAAIISCHDTLACSGQRDAVVVVVFTYNKNVISALRHPVVVYPRGCTVSSIPL